MPFTTSSSRKRGAFTNSSRQPQPAPATPEASSVAAHAKPLTCEPCPSSSDSAPDALPSSVACATFGPSWGWLPSSPESITPTSARWPVLMSQASGKPARTNAHWSGVPGGPERSWAVSEGSLGRRRKSRDHSGETLSTRGFSRSRASAEAGPSTVAIPSRGAPRPATLAPARATIALTAEDRAAVPGSSKTTRWRPVGSAPAAGEAPARASARATRATRRTRTTP
jgi:hypothetical protein